jgi:hypothetical protein
MAQPALPDGYKLDSPTTTVNWMMRKPFPDPWVMYSKRCGWQYGKKKWRIISPQGKLYHSFKKAWASPEGLELLAADSKDGKGGNNGEQVAAAEEEGEDEEEEEWVVPRKKKRKNDDDDDEEEIEADQAGNWDDDTVVGDKQEVDEEEEEWVAPRDKRKNDDDDDHDDDDDEQEEVARKQAPPPPPRKKAKKTAKTPNESSVSVKDWIASLDSGLSRFAESFEFIDWPALFNCNPHKLFIMGIPENAVLPMTSLIVQEMERAEDGGK